jgi:iron complex transport system permease protein
VAWLVGAALGVSGALLQGIARNPLASPDIIGITGGASVAAVAVLVFAPDTGSALLSVVAFAGATVVAVLMYALAYKNGFSPLRLVLIGVGIGAAARSLTTLLIVISPMYQASKALLWLTGSVYGSSWKEVASIGPWFLLLFPTAFLISRKVNSLQLGHEVDQSLGGSVDRDVLVVTAIGVALAGSAVAVAGGIGFVGLMAPHMARLLVGPVFERLMPAAALLGGFLVMAADLIGRTLVGTLDLPAGIFTAAIGAPFFIFLLYRTRHTL